MGVAWTGPYDMHICHEQASNFNNMTRTVRLVAPKTSAHGNSDLFDCLTVEPILSPDHQCME